MKPSTLILLFVALGGVGVAIYFLLRKPAYGGATGPQANGQGGGVRGYGAVPGQDAGGFVPAVADPAIDIARGVLGGGLSVLRYGAGAVGDAANDVTGTGEVVLDTAGSVLQQGAQFGIDTVTKPIEWQVDAAKTAYNKTTDWLGNTISSISPF